METVGEKLVGRFNAESIDGVDIIKGLAIKLIDEIEKIPTSGRLTAATKTAAQINILNGQMDACKLFYVEGV